MLTKVLEFFARHRDPLLWERIDAHPKPIMDVTLLAARARSMRWMD